MLKPLIATVALAFAVAPLSASASLYINSIKMKVYDGNLSGGCHLIERAADRDVLQCVKPNGIVFPVHAIRMQTRRGSTCIVDVVYQNHKPFQYRWHAGLVTPRVCKMFWENDNTLKVDAL